MSPAVKYTLGRVGLFMLFALALWPVHMNLLVKLMIAVLASAAASFILLRRWRDELADVMLGASQRRREQKERLRSALAGDDEPTTPPSASEPTGKDKDGDAPKG